MSGRAKVDRDGAEGFGKPNHTRWFRSASKLAENGLLEGPCYLLSGACVWRGVWVGWVCVGWKLRLTALWVKAGDGTCGELG